MRGRRHADRRACGSSPSLLSTYLLIFSHRTPTAGDGGRREGGRKDGRGSVREGSGEHAGSSDEPLVQGFGGQGGEKAARPARKGDDLDAWEYE